MSVQIGTLPKNKYMKEQPDVQVVHEKDHPDDVNINIVIIDIEDCCTRQTPPPKHDPGVITHYLIRVDDQKFKVKKHLLTGHQILDLVDKSHEDFFVEQLQNNGHNASEIIKPNETVDLTSFGIEKFITKPKIYFFSIDRKEFQTKHKCLTVRQILVDFAGVSPEKKTLALKVKDSAPFEYNDLNEQICFSKEVKHFTLFDNESCNVS